MADSVKSEDDRPTEEARRKYIEGMPTYQRYDAMAMVRAAARLLKRDGEKVIYRDAFRWKDDADDFVLSNHYESQNLAYLAEEWNYEIVHNFHHVAVIKGRAAVQREPEQKGRREEDYD